MAKGDLIAMVKSVLPEPGETITTAEILRRARAEWPDIQKNSVSTAVHNLTRRDDGWLHPAHLLIRVEKGVYRRLTDQEMQDAEDAAEARRTRLPRRGPS